MAVELTKSTMDVMSGLGKLLRAMFDEEDLYTEGDEERFLKEAKAGEIETASEAGQSFMSSVGFDDDIFWDAISQHRSERQLGTDPTREPRPLTFNRFPMVRMLTASQMWGAGTDQFVQSAPLMLDLIAGRAIAKGR